MKKKYKIILLVILIIIIGIPVITFATREFFIVPHMNQEKMEEENKNETQRMLEEKSKFQNERKVQNIILDTFSEEEEKKSQQEMKEIKNEEEKIKSIMKRCYGEEFERRMSKIQEESEEIKIKSLNDITQAEVDFYDIILKALEEKELTEEERTILKSFIDSQKDTIEYNESLKIRMKNILEK